MRPKRSSIVFVTIVFTALLTGFLVEHADLADPFAVEFAEPRPVGLDPVELPGGDHRVAGEVRTARGEPAADVTVFLVRPEARPGTAEPVHWAVTDEEGRFAIERLGEGEYLAALVLPGHPHTTRTLLVPVEGGEVHFTLADPLPPLETLPEIRRADLYGRVLPPVGLPPGRLASQYEVVVLPAPESHPLSGAVVRRTATGPEGNFVIENLVAENYLVHVMPTWARGGSWPSLANAYHVHEPEPRLDASLDVRLRSGEVSGGLTEPDGTPIEGALVKIWPVSDPSRIWPPATTDAAGAFLIGDLPEGRYRLRVRSGDAARETDVTVLIGQRVVVPIITLEPRTRAAGE